MKIILQIAVGILLALNVLAQPGNSFTNFTDKKGEIEVKKDESFKRSQNILVNSRIIVNSPTNKNLTFTGFDKRKMSFVFERTEPNVKNGYTWVGKIAEEPHSVVVLTVNKEIVSGFIQSQKGDVNTIEYIGNGVHLLKEIEQTKYLQSKTQPSPRPERASSLPPCNDSSNQITIGVIYERSMFPQWQNMLVQNHIYHALALTNITLSNSGLSQQVNLAFVIPDNTFGIPTPAFLHNLRNPNSAPGQMANFWRNSAKADIMIWVTKQRLAVSGGFIDGIAYQNASPPTFSQYAYGIVSRDGLLVNALAHEIGHIMGADHEPANAVPNNTFPYARGHFVDGKFRTVMAYGCPSGNCPQYLHFSNPNINLLGSPTGIANQRDNASVLKQTAPFVSKYRCTNP